MESKNILKKSLKSNTAALRSQRLNGCSAVFGVRQRSPNDSKRCANYSK